MRGGALASVFGTIFNGHWWRWNDLLALVGSIPVIGWIVVAIAAVVAVVTWLLEYK